MSFPTLLRSRPPAGPSSRTAPGRGPGRGSHARPSRRTGGTVAAFTALYAASVLVLIGSFHAAARGQEQLQFALFWAAALPPFLATAALGLRRSLSRPMSAAAVAALGAFGTLPKLLRTPSGPLYFDELMHYRQALNLTATGNVGEPNTMLAALPGFPGLHDVTASLTQLVGARTWDVAVAVIIGAHILGVLGMWALPQIVLHGRCTDARAQSIGLLAAVIYASNSGWMFFDTMFAYETLAAPLVIWALVLAVAAASTDTGRLRNLAALTLVSFAVAVTHHASALTLVTMLVLLVLVTVRSRSRASWFALSGGVLVSLAVVIAWMAPQAGLLGHYLGPNFSGSLRQLAGLFQDAAAPRQDSSSSGTRTLFAGTSLPPYEVAAAISAPLLLAALTGSVMLAQLRTRRRARSFGKTVATSRAPVGALWWSSPGAVVLSLLAMGYFATLPLLLTSSGSEVARRSWTYTWVGVGFAVAVVVDDLWHRIRSPQDATGTTPAAGIGGPLQTDRGAAAPKRSRALSRSLPAAAVLGLAVVLVGNVAAGQNEAYRFPGEYQVGSDTRSADAETQALATWARTHLPDGSYFTSDRYTAAFLASYGRLNLVVPWSRVPLWRLVKSPSTSPAALRELRTGVRYLVVDDQMATSAPQSRFWYVKNEPVTVHARPVPVANLRRFDCLPWSVAIYSSNHYTVYRLHMSRYDAQVEGRVVAALAHASGQDPSTLRWGVPLSSQASAALTSRSCPP